jgi:hypothetical protein
MTGSKHAMQCCMALLKKKRMGIRQHIKATYKGYKSSRRHMKQRA